MRRIAVVLVLITACLGLTIVLRCASSRVAGGTAETHAASSGTAAAASPSPPAAAATPETSPGPGAGRPGTAAHSDRIDFTTRILPLLQEKCSPCHFPGGRMYQRLPFDQEMTIRALGTKLFTRIREPEDQETIGAFLEQLPQPDR